MISAIIITRNEERNIGRCLDSLKWVDEIVVVDSGSEDATESICRSYTNVRFYSEPWRGFGAQKNLALDRAAGDWILSLDADEALLPETIQEIGTVIAAPSFDGYSIKRKNIYRGKWIRHCGWWPDKVLRLFRKGAGRFSERPVHEAFEMKGLIGCLNAPMLHFSYANASEMLKKAEQYSTLGALLLFKRGVKSSPVKAVAHAVAAFVRTYFIRLGLLDGAAGFLIAVTSFVYAFFRYMKLAELHEGTLRESALKGRQ